MNKSSHQEFLWAGVCCLVFVVVQILQKIIFLTVPIGNSGLSELLALGHPYHVVRSLLVLFSIILLVFPFVLFARYGKTFVMQVLIIVFFSSFVLFELGYRSVELFLVQLKWAPQATHSIPEADLVLKFELFKEIKEATYFPLLLSHGIASGLAAWCVPFQGADKILKAALAVNMFRLLLRIGGMFAGIQWMNVLTGTYYFPFILLVFIPITAWCFLRFRAACAPEGGED
jgi:hypothetical protein